MWQICPRTGNPVELGFNSRRKSLTASAPQRPSRVRELLQADDVDIDDAPADDAYDAPRQSHNFAPGYHGIVYRADVSDPAAKTSKDAVVRPHYKLQTMKWGLVPSWTKRSPDYAATLKTINCRDDSLASPGGLWATMKARKRCVVVAQGFFEWLKRPGFGARDKVPHYVRRADGRLLCMAGLWDCVRYDAEDGAGKGQGQGHYTYTIITTDSNAQLRFLHDRMPVVLNQGSQAMRTWLDPGRSEWSQELQALLKPFEGELEVYPVSKDVGKVGNDSPSFIIPVASKENKSNIANFFAKGPVKKSEKDQDHEGVHHFKAEPEFEVKTEERHTQVDATEDVVKEFDNGDMDATATGLKREAPLCLTEGERPTKKITTTTPNTVPSSSALKKPIGRPMRSATTNQFKSPVTEKKKKAGGGSQKITKFFANSS